MVVAAVVLHSLRGLRFEVAYTKVYNYLCIYLLLLGLLPCIPPCMHPNMVEFGAASVQGQLRKPLHVDARVEHYTNVMTL